MPTVFESLGLKPDDLEEARGLRPRLGFCVGEGYSREELKAQLFERGIAFTDAAVFAPVGLARRFVSKELREVLSPLSRQEVLRFLLSRPAITRRMPEIRRLKRQQGFLQRLDRAFQSGRMTYAHKEELDVFEERLFELWGDSDPMRMEIRALARAYEAWIEARGLADDPLIYRRALESLDSGYLTQPLVRATFPDRIFVFYTHSMESLERAFWQALAREIKIEWVSPSLVSAEVDEQQAVQKRTKWEQWHTLDDAVEKLLDEIDPQQDVILMPDDPPVRRVLQRAVKERGMWLEDPRDPTVLRTGEAYKRATLMLKLVAGDFSREDVVAWFRNGEVTRLVHEFGIRQGLESYRNSKLDSVYTELKKLKSQLGKKGKAAEVADAHLLLISQLKGLSTLEQEFFSATWKLYLTDLEHIQQNDLSAPARYWIDGFLRRLQDTSPPVERLKPEWGLRIYRLTQQPLKPWKRAWIFGMPSGWLSQDSVRGDYWFSARDREILSAEFEVLGSAREREQRVAGLRKWCAESEQVTFLSAEYGENGSELETIAADLRALGWSNPEAIRQGGHARWLQSFSALRPVHPSIVRLPPATTGPSALGAIHATGLDRYSRCAFQELVMGRWRIRDGREAEVDLWSNERGTILHEAVRLLLASDLSMSVDEAIQSAWGDRPIKGWIRNPRLKVFQQRKMKKILLAFLDAEKIYRERSGCRVRSLEGPPLELNEEGIRIYGIPDRIDEHADGLWIIDFKTEATLPHGDEMVNQGYRLQLAVYALAAQKQLKRQVLGAQFVQLNDKATRIPGIIPKKYNGKTPGSITQTTSKRSVLEMDPQQIWDLCHTQVMQHARAYMKGEFSPKPKNVKECTKCSSKDLCGRRRLVDEEESDSE